MKLLTVWLLSLCLYSPLLLASPQLDTFISLSDIHLDKKKADSRYGDETSIALLNQLIEKVESVIQHDHPKFILLLGDLPLHTKEAQQNEAASNTQLALKKLRALSTANLPLFYVTGNNDPLDGNYRTFTNKKGQTPLSLDPNHGWPALHAKPLCRQSPHTACIISEPNALYLGFYSAYPLGSQTKLRLIVMNTVIFSPWYKSGQGTTQHQSVQKELTWLAKQLAAAKNNGEAVIIAMHIPPGQDAYSGKSMWTTTVRLHNGQTILQSFVSLVSEYHSIIRGILTGHTHMDEIRMLIGPDNKLKVVATSTPGLSVDHQNNPGFKVYLYNHQNFDLIDYVTYYTIPGSKAWGNKSYSFQHDYRCQSQNILTCLENTSKQDLQNNAKKNYAVRNPDYQPKSWQAVYDAITIQSDS